MNKKGKLITFNGRFDRSLDGACMCILLHARVFLGEMCLCV